MPCIRASLLIALAQSAAFAVPAHAQLPIWRNDWTTQQAPSLGPLYYSAPYSIYQEPFAFSSDGELLMRTPSPSAEDDEITRFTAAGAVRWHVSVGSLGASSQPGYDPMLGYADGSAIVVTQQGNAVVRIDADGTLAWSQTLVVNSIATLGPQAVAALGCNKVTALDVQSGQTLWTLTLTPQLGSCNTSLIGDPAGNGYAALVDNTSSGEVVQLFKFSSAGQILWQRGYPSSYAAQFLGSGAATVYLASPTGLQAFSAADGTLAWSAPDAHGLCMAGVPAEPIVFLNGEAQRLAEGDGQPRWHQSVSSASFAGGSAARVLVEGNALDAASGAPLWQAALPPTDQNGSNIVYLNSGFLSDGSAMFGGYAFGTSGRPFLVRADAASGQLLGSPLILARTQSPVSNSVRVDSNTIVRAAVTVGLSGSDLRMRAVNADSGTTRWNVLEPLDHAYPGFIQSARIAARGDVVAVTVPSFTSGWVVAFQRSGGKKWKKQLFLNLEAISAPFDIFDPLVDDSGNVYVSYGSRALCPFPLSLMYPTCKQLSVAKIGGDGSTLWERDDVLGSYVGEQIFAGSITLAGDDVVVVSDFTEPYDADSLLKLSGADGSVLWGSSIYRENGNQVSGVFVEPDDGNLIVTGPGWTKLDSALGDPIWSNPPENGCGQSCYAYKPVIFDDGSLLSAAQDQDRMWVILLPAAEGAMAQTWHPDQTDTSVTSSLATLPFRDSNGDIWLRTIKRYGDSGDAIFYLSRFDLQSGTFLSQQAMTLYGTDPLLQWLSPLPLAAPEGGQLPVAFDTNQAPAPYTSGDAMLDSTILATGNLGVQVFSDRSYAVPGDVLNFHVVASYNGSAPIGGARVLFDFTWPGHATVLSCATQAASNCVVDARSGAMTATFDVQSGGHIDIIGQLRVAASSNPQLHALVAGPIGLNELDTSDNGISVLIDQSIFKNGFE